MLKLYCVTETKAHPGDPIINGHQTGEMILEEAKKDYAKTVYSKGNNTTGLLYKYVLKNAVMPTITFVGMLFACNPTMLYIEIFGKKLKCSFHEL